MSGFDIGPVSGMNAGGAHYYGKPRRRVVERKELTPSPRPSYEVEPGAPVGAKKWLKSLFYEGAVRVSVDRVVDLLGRRREPDVEPETKPATERKATSPAEVSSGLAYQIFSEAVALEKRDTVVPEAKQRTPRHIGYFIPLAALAALVFLLTVVFLDVAFGTATLAGLLSLVLP